MWKYIKEFLRSPLILFLLPFSITITVAATTPTHLEKYKVPAIIGVGVVFALGGVLYGVYKEKISATEVREQNIKLQGEIRELRLENENLKELEKRIPKLIRYKTVRKNIKILNEKGDAHWTKLSEGINESDRPLTRKRYVLFTKNTISDVINPIINGDAVIPEIKSERYGDVCRSQIIFELTKPVGPGKPININYGYRFDREYEDAFSPGGKSSSGHGVNLLTDELVFEIEAPKNFIFHPNPEIDVRDSLNKVEIHREEDRILRECPPLLGASRRRITWRVSRPRLSYEYRILFSLKEGS